jgi:hypothetical protein
VAVVVVLCRQLLVLGLWAMHYDNDSLDKTTDHQDICKLNKVEDQSLVSKLASLLDYIANIKLADQ